MMHQKHRQRRREGQSENRKPEGVADATSLSGNVNLFSGIIGHLSDFASFALHPAITK